MEPLLLNLFNWCNSKHSISLSQSETTKTILIQEKYFIFTLHKIMSENTLQILGNAYGRHSGHFFPLLKLFSVVWLIIDETREMIFNAQIHKYVL